MDSRRFFTMSPNIDMTSLRPCTIWPSTRNDTDTRLQPPWSTVNGSAPSLAVASGSASDKTSLGPSSLASPRLGPPPSTAGCESTRSPNEIARGALLLASVPAVPSNESLYRFRLSSSSGEPLPAFLTSATSASGGGTYLSSSASSPWLLSAPAVAGGASGAGPAALEALADASTPAAPAAPESVPVDGLGSLPASLDAVSAAAIAARRVVTSAWSRLSQHSLYISK